MTAAQRRKAKLRQHIIEQATDLYRTNGGKDGGFEKTTIEEIAEKSDISFRTFFRYFESKTDVIYLDIGTATQHLREFIEDRPIDEPPVLAALNGRLDQVDAFLDDPGNRDRLLRSLRAPQFKDRLPKMRSDFRHCVVEFLTEETPRGTPLDIRDARLAACLIVDIVGDVLHDWADDTSIDVRADSLQTLGRLPNFSKLLKKLGFGANT